MDYWSILARDASEIQRQTEASCPAELSLLKDSFNLFAGAFESIPLTAGGPAVAARMAILSQALNSFRTMISSASEGFYIQTLIPLRHAYEGWLSFWYMAKYPEEAERWLNPTWEMRPPKAETMLNNIDHPAKEMKSRIREFYGELNRFAHIDPVAVLSRIHHEGEKAYIGVGIRFSADDFRTCAYGVLLWLGNYLDAASSVVPQTHEWHSQHKDVEARILAFIQSHAPPASSPNLLPDGPDAA